MDRTFGEGGVATGKVTLTDNFDPERIIVARSGQIYVLSSRANASAAVQRLSADGVLDTSFGVNGTANVDGHLANALDLIELADGSLIVALEYSTNAPNYQLRIAHLSRDGVLDSQFAGNGFHETSLSNNQTYGFYGRVRLGLDAQENIYVAGMRRTDFAQDYFIQKLSRSGVLDTTYGVNGELLVDTNQEWGTLIQDLIVSPNGEASLSGMFAYQRRPLIAHITAAGQLVNNSAGTGLSSIADIFANENGSGGMVRLANGQLVAAYSNLNTRQIDIFSFDNSGVPNAAFGNAGKLSLNVVKTRANSAGVSIIEQSDGTLLSLAVIVRRASHRSSSSTT